MSLVAPVKDGKIQDVTKKEDEKQSSKTSNSTLDKQAFLQLLVAQMKYQDPLEPTSNTEYVSQLATFSSLEEMQNMRSSLDLQRASSLIGQEVYIKTTNPTTGDTDFVHGRVDYVEYQNNKPYLSVDGELYPIDDLDSVYDQEYSEAYNKAYEWQVKLNKLPSLSRLTLSDAEAVAELKEIYDGMTSYQKTFLTEESKNKLDGYVDRMELLKKAQEALDGANKTDQDETTGSSNADGKTEETDKTEESGKTEDTGKTQEPGKTEDSGKTEDTGKTQEPGKTEDSGKTEESGKAEDSGKTQEAGAPLETDKAEQTEAEAGAAQATGAAGGTETAGETDVAEPADETEEV